MNVNTPREQEDNTSLIFRVIICGLVTTMGAYLLIQACSEKEQNWMLRIAEVTLALEVYIAANYFYSTAHYILNECQRNRFFTSNYPVTNLEQTPLIPVANQV